GRWGTGPNHKSQSNPSGTGGVSVGLLVHCGHTGRLDQLCISRRVPIRPSLIHCLAKSLPLRLLHARRWVLTPVFFAVSMTRRASCIRFANGLWITTCLPFFIAATEI